MMLYAYDAQLDYLTSAKYDDDGNGSWDATHTWSYDAAGNRATASAQPGTWAYDNLNRMTQSPMGVYENDLLGNRVWQNRYAPGGRRMEWDELNRMTSACTQTGGARYEYRADGMRTLKVEGLSLVWQNLSEEEQEEEGSGFYDAVWATNKPTTRYFYDGQMPIEDDFTRLVNNVMTVDVTRNGLGARGIDVIEKTTPTSTTTAFPLYDGHGNMVATLAPSGLGFAVNDRRSYDAWGIVRAGAGTGDPKGRYCANLGHVQDDESGLVYMRARYYEALSGRFVSEDPARDGANWFVYCGNDPVSFGDFSGRIRFTIGRYEFRLDITGDMIGDLHVKENGKEIISVFQNGVAKHKSAANEWTKDLVKTLVNASRSGDSNARALLSKMKKMGGFGVDPDIFKRGGFVGIAYTSVDAYAQQDPDGFFDLMQIIFTGGRG